LGFGGAVLALPFLLLIVDDPLIFLPLIAVHLMIFSSWIAWRGHRAKRGDRVGDSAGTVSGESNIDWNYLLFSMKIMIIPKIIGVFGLLTLPPRIMSTIIFSIVICYA